VKRIWLDYLNDILDAVKDIKSFVEGQTYETFIKDNMRRNAVGNKGFQVEFLVVLPQVTWHFLFGDLRPET